jgi:phospholipid transport system substrate-binding protein
MLTVFVVAAALASPGPQTPLAVVKAADSDVSTVLKSTAATVEKLAEKAERYVDFAELAKRAMGKQWASLDKKQQDEFSATMKGLLRANYAQKAIKDGRGEALVEYGAEAIEGNEASVKTTLVMKQDRFPVLYKLYRLDAKGAWRVYDVVTEDVSLVTTYADQFRTVIAKKGFDGLLSSLKAKKEQLERQGQQAKPAEPATTP